MCCRRRCRAPRQMGFAAQCLDISCDSVFTEFAYALSTRPINLQEIQVVLDPEDSHVAMGTPLRLGEPRDD